MVFSRCAVRPKDSGPIRLVHIGLDVLYVFAAPGRLADVGKRDVRICR